MERGVVEWSAVEVEIRRRIERGIAKVQMGEITLVDPWLPLHQPHPERSLLCPHHNALPLIARGSVFAACLRSIVHKHVGRVSTAFKWRIHVCMWPWHSQRIISYLEVESGLVGLELRGG